MTVVHFANVSALYPWVVISSLAKQLEKPPFCHSYTVFSVWPRDHYMSLQRLCTMWAWANDHATSHSSEQGTIPTSSLISNQAILYRTCGGTCCLGVSTTKTRSLANLSKTNHKPWRSQPSPPLQTLLKPQHRTPPRSPHTMMDGRPTLSTHNTSQTQYHKDRIHRWLKTVGLSNTTNHKNPILKYGDLGNQLMHTASVY
jgi:hypothetical protein